MDNTFKRWPSNRIDPLKTAFENMPERYIGKRESTSKRDMILMVWCLRRRLEYLVSIEERFGDNQVAADEHRAERNAIISALEFLQPHAEVYRQSEE